MTTLGLSGRSSLHKTPDPHTRSIRFRLNSSKITKTEATTVRRRIRLRDRDPNRSPFQRDPASRDPAQQMAINPAAPPLFQLIPSRFLRLQLTLLRPVPSALDCCSSEDPSALMIGSVHRRRDQSGLCRNSTMHLMIQNI